MFQNETFEVIFTEIGQSARIPSFIPLAAVIDSFNPEPGTAANSGGPTALVDSTGCLAIGSGLNNLWQRLPRTV